MYAWIWRHLPGPWQLKLVLVVLLSLAIVWLMFFTVFPWVEDASNFNDITVE
jgi:hypothetical protein